MTIRRLVWLLLACCALGIAVPLALGLGYSGRLSTPEGFFRVSVADGPFIDVRRPRRTAVVVFDGLGHEEAAGMRSFARLRAYGQCRRTHVGSPSLSRPVYAVLSTGLEQDRSGARGNDDPRPIAAESVWQIARAAGLRVAAVSELPWWRELFPGGFDDYAIAPRSANLFEMVAPAQLQLIHPLYVDETGHESGAASPQYAAAVARADAELAGFLDTLDLSQDLIIVTADHGHALLGGHGGGQERIAHVLTCHAGAGVRRAEAAGTMQATAIGPSLALLLGLRFPADMRAGEDDLDVLWEIADPAAFPGDYLAERRAGVERFRAANAAHLRRWQPDGAGSWSRFYAWHRWLQLRAALPFAALLSLLLVTQARAHRTRGAAAFGLAVVVVFCAALFALQIALRGSFDLSAVSHRAQFIGFTAALSVGVTLATIATHAALRRDLRALMIDIAALSAVGTLLSAAHPVVFGWHPGFPGPPPALLFFPYFAALVLAALGGAGVLLALGVALVRRRSGT